MPRGRPKKSATAPEQPSREQPFTVDSAQLLKDALVVVPSALAATKYTMNRLEVDDPHLLYERMARRPVDGIRLIATAILEDGFKSAQALRPFLAETHWDPQYRSVVFDGLVALHWIFVPHTAFDKDDPSSFEYCVGHCDLDVEYLRDALARHLGIARADIRRWIVRGANWLAAVHRTSGRRGIGGVAVPPSAGEHGDHDDPFLIGDARRGIW